MIHWSAGKLLKIRNTRVFHLRFAKCKKYSSYSSWQQPIEVAASNWVILRHRMAFGNQKRTCRTAVGFWASVTEFVFGGPTDPSNCVGKFIKLVIMCVSCRWFHHDTTNQCHAYGVCRGRMMQLLLNAIAWRCFTDVLSEIALIVFEMNGSRMRNIEIGKCFSCFRLAFNAQSNYGDSTASGVSTNWRRLLFCDPPNSWG